MTLTTTQPSLIDLARLPVPAIIEALNYEALQTAFTDRFVAFWSAAREADPTLPQFDVERLDTDPVAIAAQAFSFIRLLDRARVNDALKAVLLPWASGSDLEALVARNGVGRIAGETDMQLARRYLLSFERGATGSAANYLFHAYSVAPDLLDAAVNGQAVHGRRGEVDIIVATALPEDQDDAPGPDPAQVELVRDAVTGTRVRPEATAVNVAEALRLPYAVALTLTLDANRTQVLEADNAKARVEAACAARALIGGRLPVDYITGAAYGPGIIDVDAGALTDIVATRYQLPVLTGVTVTVAV